MTVHWNPRRGFVDGLNTASSNAEEYGDGSGGSAMAKLLQAMRDVADSRPAVIEEARKLLANPDYPSADVLREIAGLLASALEEDRPT